MSIVDKAIGAVVSPILGIVDKAVTDKDEAARLKADITKLLITERSSTLDARMQVLLSEANGESWLQRNWRPILMLVIVAIVANNYLVAPYLGAMFGVGLTLPLPQSLWDLMTLGVGGYIAGQTAERGIATWQQGQVAKEQAKAGRLAGEIDAR
ncbi:3TM-type holin [Salinicola sp. JS01]|uniref:3TM-type holin n=1 Tax=Salinicola sp. JS01 TaxID=3050071 RepID=UPI00255B47C1|nr:3TM-type holin [Salinicola sp. JS01]WIX34135.1 3TM-type holin [Salinicola sp. JS01]